MRKKILTYCVIVGLALVCALNYELFVFPNQFAPAGLNGICTMIQHVFGISVGYLSMIINIPLAIAVYLKVSKSLAIRSMVYVLTFSLALVILDHVDLSWLAYDTASSTILGPLVAGIINGSCYSWLLKASAYTGGTDFIAALIHKRRPDQSVLGLIFTLNVAVAVISFFVYGYQMEPVILCILYSFASTTVSQQAVKSGRSATRFEIITDYPEEISNEIITKLHHSATVMPAKGMYSGKPTNLVYCVVNNTQISKLSAIIQRYPKTFAVMDSVSEVMGNFKQLTNKGDYAQEFLDSGDGKAV
ncbi:MAG: YitT family protein [Oscillospiraceae bacterium]|nr:YitT family protein [Oscillospiraceae bacterium]